MIKITQRRDQKNGIEQILQIDIRSMVYGYLHSIICYFYNNNNERSKYQLVSSSDIDNEWSNSICDSQNINNSQLLRKRKNKM